MCVCWTGRRMATSRWAYMLAHAGPLVLCPFVFPDPDPLAASTPTAFPLPAPSIAPFRALETQPPVMEKEAAAHQAKKGRRKENRRQEPEVILTLWPHELQPTSVSEESQGHEPPPASEEGDGVDRISGLPDAVLGEIISLLPTKDGARTQSLASRWRHLWRTAPLNLDYRGLPVLDDDDIISQILEAHSGPARRLSLLVHDLLYRREIFDNWLGSAALDNLQELELVYGGLIYLDPPLVSLPATVFRFSDTLRVVTVTECRILDDTIEMLQFPQLRELGLERVMISSGSLQSMIAGCPVLQCLLLRGTHGFNSLLISSPTLISIGVSVSSMELVIEDAPMLEKLLLLAPYADLHVSVISAPRLETLGCLYDRDYNFKLVFGTTIIEELRMVSFTKVVSSVKTLDINMHILSLNLIVDLMRCFPCLEKLYIQTSGEPRDNNSWHREHCDLRGCLDIHLKTVVLKNYRGTKSEATFAAFFIQNAKMLELMTFAGTDYNKKFIAQQKKLLKLNKRASSGARFHFTTSHFDRGLINNVHDLSVADPFKCTCCSVPPRC